MAQIARSSTGALSKTVSTSADGAGDCTSSTAPPLWLDDVEAKSGAAAILETAEGLLCEVAVDATVSDVSELDVEADVEAERLSFSILPEDTVSEIIRGSVRLAALTVR